MKILADGSVEGQTFSGDKYKGKYPSPHDGEETYREYYERVEKCKNEGFHLGDLSWSDYTDYLYGCPGGGGQHISHYTIGKVPDHAWVTHDSQNQNDDDY